MSGEGTKGKQPLKPILGTFNNVKINYCLVGERYPVEEFIDGLTKKEKTEIISLFNLLDTNKGRIWNKQKFKKLEDNTYEAIFEFKTYQVRIACFTRPGYNFNLIYGFKKKTNRWPQRDLKAMKRNCRLFNEEEKKRK